MTSTVELVRNGIDLSHNMFGRPSPTRRKVAEKGRGPAQDRLIQARVGGSFGVALEIFVVRHG